MATATAKVRKHIVFADEPSTSGRGPSTGVALEEETQVASRQASSLSLVSRSASMLDSPALPRSIHEAAEKGQAGAIVKLIERSIEFDINVKDKYQRTALHWAAEFGHMNCVETLLDYGCDVRLIECNGRTPMHLAAREGHAEALATLFEALQPEERERHANLADFCGITPVFLSVQKQEPGNPAFNFLMSNGGRWSQGAKKADAVPSPRGDRPEPPPQEPQPGAQP